nr:MAG TPA: hypothetical protein [Caudoviricetes sp.]
MKNRRRTHANAGSFVEWVIVRRFFLCLKPPIHKRSFSYVL